MIRRYATATAASAALFVGLFTAVALLAPAPRIVWNASASVPVGLYAIDVGAVPRRGDLVAIRPPARVERLLAARRYVPAGTPLLKRVAAREGARVCRSAMTVTVDGRAVATARPRDRRGRPLPRWTGCRTLGESELFLLAASPDSLDSRYFGSLPAAGVIGRAYPLLTRDAPGAPLRWRGGHRERATVPGPGGSLP